MCFDIEGNQQMLLEKRLLVHERGPSQFQHESAAPRKERLMYLFTAGCALKMAATRSWKDMNEILTDEQLEALLNDSNAELSDGEDDEFSFLTGDFPVKPEASAEDKATVDETVDSSEELDDRNDPKTKFLFHNICQCDL
ncbi:uncharacterized protein LOC124712419 [Schistocerca piceifrons]|uniref:uncharacterized protein LOC124712419 n=1 Tax=Schistocerca piceifrons TaxID=274613 RepID=UPI001F5FC968|nr:uncharacterized protein LOC124712419 [Schistocerca piceifrons]